MYVSSNGLSSFAIGPIAPIAPECAMECEICSARAPTSECVVPRSACPNEALGGSSWVRQIKRGSLRNSSISFVKRPSAQALGRRSQDHGSAAEIRTTGDLGQSVDPARFARPGELGMDARERLTACRSQGPPRVHGISRSAVSETASYPSISDFEEP